MDVEVVPDDVDGTFGIRRGDQAHKAPQVLGLPRLAARRDDLPGAHIEGRDDCLRAVAGVLPLPTRAATGLAGAPMVREAVFQGLYTGHFVDAEHGAIGWRMETEIADLRHFFPELRVGAVQPAPDQMRPYVALRENPLHARFADRRDDPASDGLLSDLLERPRDRDVLRFPAAVSSGVLLTDRLTGQGNDLAAGDGVELRGVAATRKISKALKTFAQESTAPTLDASDRNAQARGDLLRASAFGARHDDPRPSGVTLSARRRAHPTGQFCGFLGRQLQHQRRSTASRRGFHLSDLPYRHLSEMYSVLPPS